MSGIHTGELEFTWLGVAHDLRQEAAGISRLQGIKLLALHMWRGHKGCQLRAICFIPNLLKASHAAVAEQLA